MTLQLISPRLAGYAFAVTLVMSAPMNPAFSATPILGTPVVVGAYYEQNGMIVCEDSRECSVNFSAIPGARSLLLTEVHCRVLTRSEIREAWLGVLGGMPFGREKAIFPAQYYFNANSMIAYVLDLQTEYLFKGQPAIRVLTVGDSDFIDLNCQITGRLSPADLVDRNRR
jgi:hypothetical protein